MWSELQFPALVPSSGTALQSRVPHPHPAPGPGQQLPWGTVAPSAPQLQPQCWQEPVANLTGTLCTARGPLRNTELAQGKGFSLLLREKTHLIWLLGGVSRKKTKDAQDFKCLV